MSDYQETLEFYDRLVDTNDKFDRKGKSMPYTSANGYMFSLLNKDGELGIRLSKESQKAFKERYNATEFRSHGAVMRDYVKIPTSLYDDMNVLAKYMDESYEFVMSLPPK